MGKTVCARQGPVLGTLVSSLFFSSPSCIRIIRGRVVMKLGFFRTCFHSMASQAYFEQLPRCLSLFWLVQSGNQRKSLGNSPNGTDLKILGLGSSHGCRYEFAHSCR